MVLKVKGVVRENRALKGPVDPRVHPGKEVRVECRDKWDHLDSKGSEGLR